MEKKLKGTAWKFGDNINADEACQFYKNMNIDLNDKNALAKICMTGYDPDFPNKAKEGDFIVGGKNFGSGHMHAHFYYSIKALGIRAVIAESVFHRLYREAINSGLPLIICPSTDPIKNGDPIEIEVDRGIISNERTREVIRAEVLSPILKEIIEQGGIDGYIKVKIEKL
jgi:3-isopropylmalate/(R)-2-methylmalate dehydratase small subunit